MSDVGCRGSEVRCQMSDVGIWDLNGGRMKVHDFMVRIVKALEESPETWRVNPAAVGRFQFPKPETRNLKPETRNLK